MLGSGKRLFPESDHRTPLQLIETKHYNTVLVSMKYALKK
jgi:mannose-1-phosphate guanylyltransferase